jgi:hypothetical protein
MQQHQEGKKIKFISLTKTKRKYNHKFKLNTNLNSIQIYE